jgi:hypothetical protein
MTRPCRRGRLSKRERERERERERGGEEQKRRQTYSCEILEVLCGVLESLASASARLLVIVLITGRVLCHTVELVHDATGGISGRRRAARRHGVTQMVEVLVDDKLVVEVALALGRRELDDACDVGDGAEHRFQLVGLTREVILSGAGSDSECRVHKRLLVALERS